MSYLHRLSPALRALGSCVCAFSLATFSVAASGCIVETSNDPPPDYSYNNNQPQLDANPQEVTIDTDQTIVAEPGLGVGLYVEYATGGKWHITTTCDTETAENVNRVPCAFDAHLSVGSGASITKVTGEALEGADSAQLTTSGEADISFVTGSDQDGVHIEATPGAPLRIEMYLDNQPAPRFIYWIGKSVLHQGAPTDPIDLKPGL
jgi:hypothetical protein